MDASEILKDEYEEYSDSVVAQKRERLFAVVSGGMSKQYLGKEFQVSDIDKMDDSQVSRLYCRYEARLGASMTKTLGNSLINLYVFGISKYFDVPDPPKLIQDLEEDPFINNALNSTCCELYYKYGMYLAPFTAVITTAQHISFNNNKEATPSSESENVDIKNE